MHTVCYYRIKSTFLILSCRAEQPWRGFWSEGALFFPFLGTLCGVDTALQNCIRYQYTHKWYFKNRITAAVQKKRKQNVNLNTKKSFAPDLKNPTSSFFFFIFKTRETLLELSIWLRLRYDLLAKAKVVLNHRLVQTDGIW